MVMTSVAMANVLDVAKYFIYLGDDEEEGDPVTNMKLQKLLYYAQGFHLALNNRPLFQDQILAWIHGPVVSIVYHKYKGYGRNGISADREFDVNVLDGETRELLDEVWGVYGQYSGARLRNMTHDEVPWKETAPNEEIKHEKLREFFLTRIN